MPRVSAAKRARIDKLAAMRAAKASKPKTSSSAAKPEASSTAAKPSKSESSSSAAKTTHPSYADMVEKAVRDLQNHKGSSRTAIHNYIVGKFNVHAGKMCTSNLRHTLLRLLKTGDLKLIKGTGANGTYKLGTAEDKKKAAEKNAMEEGQAVEEAQPKAPKKSTTPAQKKATVKEQTVKSTPPAAPKKADPRKKAVKKGSAAPKKAAAKK